MTGGDPYVELADGILQHKVKLLGLLAVKKAQAIPAFTLGADGHVARISGDPVAAIDTLLARFEELAGRLSTTTARIAVEPILRRNPTLPLPTRLR